MAGTDGAAAAARAALEPLLAPVPALPAAFLPGVERYVALLLEANGRLNLTRVVEPGAVARLHILDSLAALPLLDPLEGAALDLGSGGGLPGIPLALARPDREWTLVDSVGKKAAALASFVEALGLRNVRVLSERAETLGRDPAHREAYGVVVARACAALPVLVELALPLLAVGGSLIAWKGPLTEEDEEVRRGRAALAVLGGELRSVLPAGLALLGGHTFVIASKERQTPARFPRRPGEPARRPLG